MGSAEVGPRVSAGEFEELYRATSHDLFAYVRRRCQGDPENLVAETYAVAWRRRADLPAPMLRRAWLFGVARTLVAADARLRAQEGAAHLNAATVPTPPAADEGESEAIALVRSAMADLATHHREVIELVEWERLTIAELSVALGVRPGTARVRLHRARQALARDPRLRRLLAEGPVPTRRSAERVPTD
ncbi:RNA polymerase sigma factor [Nocardioides dubius]|uniref:RNA polymerase sigma factor n=1 Tax=Nocardioides dubius TaxID=317019 RepID=A0ABN1TIV1_9ACTN